MVLISFGLSQLILLSFRWCRLRIHLQNCPTDVLVQYTAAGPEFIWAHEKGVAFHADLLGQYGVQH
jgi:hypothetical protein